MLFRSFQIAAHESAFLKSPKNYVFTLQFFTATVLFIDFTKCLIAFFQSVFNATFKIAIFSKSHFQTVNPNGHLLLFPLMVAMNQVLDISLCVWIS